MISPISIVIPAKNEEKSITRLVSQLVRIECVAEVIIVDDGSSDSTRQKALEAGARVISHPYSKGNGAAIKTGAMAASSEWILFMDADGQHRPQDIPKLIERVVEGYDMVVGARSRDGQASAGRAFANNVYNRLASYMVGQKVDDLTSGFRLVNAEKFREFLYLYPNGFSYPTTSTMAFFRAGYSVGYQDVTVPGREGKSHIKPVQDGIRFLLIIFKIGTLYSPLKIFFPVSLLFFMTGIVYYGYTFMISGRFTNMSALLLTTSVVVFLIGLVSEQVTQLMYKQTPAESSLYRKRQE